MISTRRVREGAGIVLTAGSSLVENGSNKVADYDNHVSRRGYISRCADLLSRLCEGSALTAARGKRTSMAIFEENMTVKVVRIKTASRSWRAWTKIIQHRAVVRERSEK